MLGKDYTYLRIMSSRYSSDEDEPYGSLDKKGYEPSCYSLDWEDFGDRPCSNSRCKKTVDYYSQKFTSNGRIYCPNCFIQCKLCQYGQVRPYYHKHVLKCLDRSKCSEKKKKDEEYRSTRAFHKLVGW